MVMSASLSVVIHESFVSAD